MKRANDFVSLLKWILRVCGMIREEKFPRYQHISWNDYPNIYNNIKRILRVYDSPFLFPPLSLSLSASLSLSLHVCLSSSSPLSTILLPFSHKYRDGQCIPPWSKLCNNFIFFKILTKIIVDACIYWYEWHELNDSDFQHECHINNSKPVHLKKNLYRLHMQHRGCWNPSLQSYTATGWSQAEIVLSTSNSVYQ